jgi:hypothetical protein
MAENQPVHDKRAVLKRTMRALNGTVETLSMLERDPPLVKLAELERIGAYDITGLREAGNDILHLASSVNDYRRRYWQLENNIKQSFISTMRSKGYLPASSREVDSLKGSMPEALIKGDDRVWKYSYDRYIVTISEQVGRDGSDAPTSEEVWDLIERKWAPRIDDLVRKVNVLIPQILSLRSRLRSLLRSPDRAWKEVRVKDPKVTQVRRPIRPIMVMRRPIPVQKPPRRPRKRLVGGPKRQVIGPEGGGR